jgi:hypothetical protein
MSHLQHSSSLHLQGLIILNFATAALDKLRAARKYHRVLPTIPACRGYLRDASDHIISREMRTLRTELPEYELRAYFKNATTGQTRSMIPSAGLLTDQPAQDSLTVSGLSWSNLVTTGYPSAYANDDTALRLISARNTTKSRRFRCQARAPWCNRFLIHLHRHLKETKTAADIGCIIIKGIEN